MLKHLDCAPCSGKNAIIQVDDFAKISDAQWHKQYLERADCFSQRCISREFQRHVKYNFDNSSCNGTAKRKRYKAERFCTHTPHINK
uniref:Uncharacterized protein n=1 Tax=Parascaris univalens TaxID=6257 RepID=A0A915A4D3_PARUN